MQRLREHQGDVKYANEQQRVVVGGGVFEWQREADSKKSDKLMGKDSRAPRIDRGRTKKPLRPNPATPGINNVGVNEYHEEDEDGKSFTLQKILEHYRKHIDLFAGFGYEEEHVRAQPGMNTCFGCGAYHRQRD